MENELYSQRVRRVSSVMLIFCRLHNIRYQVVIRELCAESDLWRWRKSALFSQYLGTNVAFLKYMKNISIFITSLLFR